MSSTQLNAIKTLLEMKTAEDVFSGVVLVTKSGDILLEQAYGIACKEFEVPNKTDTKFNIGSLNKIITKTAILQLHQKGLLGFDDIVGKHLPSFPDEIASKVSIRQLLEFTSGMGDYFNERFPAAISNLRTLDDFVELFIDDHLLFTPGEKFHYSNAGYVVLGKIIESISGLDYYEYIRQNIYHPAGMNDSDHYERDDPINNRAFGYTKYRPGSEQMFEQRRNNFFIIGSKGSSAGGGCSTVQDLHRFDMAIENNVLLDETHSLMVMRPLDAPLDKTPSIAGFAGGAPGLTALYLKFFKLGYVVFILSNYDPEDIEPLSEEIRKIFIPDEDSTKVRKMKPNE